ncbi:unnamed protein product [Ectocarpus sp. 6 AP-2014]
MVPGFRMCGGTHTSSTCTIRHRLRGQCTIMLTRLRIFGTISKQRCRWSPCRDNVSWNIPWVGAALHDNLALHNNLDLTVHSNLALTPSCAAA